MRFVRLQSFINPCLALIVTAGCAQAADVSEQYADLSSGRIFFRDSGGNGEAVVWLHPGSGNSAVFEKQIEPVTAAGFRFIAYDRAGQGRSTRATAPSDRAAPEVQELMDHLGIARFHLVGVAAGGGVALQYVLAQPQRVLSLVLANSIGNVEDASYVEMGRRMRPREFNALPVELRELGPSYRAMNPEGVQRWLELSRSGQPAPEPAAVAGATIAQPTVRPPGSARVTFAALGALAVPTLLLTGDADLYTPPSVLRLFREHMPSAELVVVPEAGHASHWENPSFFNERVLAFLRRH
jgi:pimeloyl-ACP methyl ester carboxylesterase